MSDKPMPMPDAEALAKFKECFGIKAEPIESAYQAVDRLTKDISNKTNEKKVVEEAITAKESDKQKAWDTFYSKTYTESLLESTQKRSDFIDKDVENLKNDLKSLEEKIEAAEAELARAQSAKKGAPLAALKTHLGALDQRLKAVGMTLKDNVEKEFKDPVEAAFKGKVDAGKVELAVNALNARAEQLCAPPELKKKQDDIAKRLKELGEKTYKNDQVLGKIADSFKRNEQNIAVLNGDIESQLKQSELHSNEFASRFAGAVAQLEALGKTKSLDLADIAFPAMQKASKDLAKTASTALADEQFASLVALEKQIDDAQQENETADGNRITCEAKYKEISESHATFRTRSEAHKKVTNGELGEAKGKITESWNLMQKYDFAEALERLAIAEDLLDDLNETVIGEEAQKKLKADAEAKLQKAAEAQKLKEEADNVASLDAIGRDGKLKQWLIKVGKLIDGGQLSVNVGNAWDLNNNGDTIEVRVTLSPLSSQDNLQDNFFVVHYHPHGNGKNTYGSLMHCKAYKSAPKFKNVDIDSSISWVKSQVPSLGAIRSQF